MGQVKTPVFGIRADGHVVQLGFPAANIAERVAKDLFDQGYAVVEIVNHSSGEVVKSFYSTVRALLKSA